MPKKYFFCMYLGRYAEFDFYEADKCLVYTTDEQTARRIAGEKMYISEEFWKNIEVYEMDLYEA